MRRAAILFGGQCLDYLLIAANFRAIALGLYVETAILDLAIGVLGFTMLKQMMAAQGHVQMVAYALGGMTGTLLAIFITNLLGWA